MFVFIVLCACVFMVQSATLTITIGEDLPEKVVVNQGDTLKFTNVARASVHFLESTDLPEFNSGFLYPYDLVKYKGGKQHTRLQSTYSYELRGMAVGTYTIRTAVGRAHEVNKDAGVDILDPAEDDEDDVGRELEVEIVLYGCPWDEHPNFPGPRQRDGATRPSQALIPATRKNALNTITPPSVRTVGVKVTFIGNGEVQARAGVQSPEATVWSEARTVDGAGVQEFQVDARSLFDGELMLAVQVDDQIYHIPTHPAVFKDTKSVHSGTKTVINAFVTEI